MRSGQVERHTHDYRRHGTTDLFAALDAKTGAVIGARKGRHRALEFRAFLDQLEAAVPTDLDLRLVLDTAATHKSRLVRGWLVKRPRWHLHFTPTSASWLNLVKTWFALLTRRRLRHFGVSSSPVRAYRQRRDVHPVPSFLRPSLHTRSRGQRP
jgi:transposase